MHARFADPIHVVYFIETRGGGGGGTSIYVPRERPPFSALNFCSGASPFLAARHSLHFLPLRRPSLSKYIYVQAIHGRPQPAYCSQPEWFVFGQRPGVSGRPECQPNASCKVSSGDPYFHARAHSAVLHFHAQVRSGAHPPPQFSLCRDTYLPKCGASAPPPPPPPPPRALNTDLDYFSMAHY